MVSPRNLAWWRVCFLVWLAAARGFADTNGVIYFVLGSDTALWDASGGINIDVQTNHFSPSLFTDPAGRAYGAMDPAWRAQFVDSFGNPLKLTWWMLVGSVYGQCDNLNTPVPNLMPLHLMRKYHGAALQAAGDELTLHYHTFLWSDYAGDGVYYWNQAKTFHECRADFDLALAQALIEEETFTVTFRSGWHYMDNEWQTYIDTLWPYNMDDDSPNKSSEPAQPFYNVLDWSHAPTNFVPFHPSATNYQLPGAEPAWNVRSVKTPNVTQATVDEIFQQAAAGTNEVVSFWAHLPESFFLTDMARMDQLIHTSASNFPGVSFRYCSAIEAMQRWRRITNTQPISLSVAEEDAGGQVTLRLRTDRPLFQAQPFVALKDVSQNYRIVPCAPAGSNAWTAVMPLPKSSLAKAGVAVIDPAGNLAIRIVRWVPDDQFVDDLDPGYSEPSGTWEASKNAAWGVDSRIGGLKPNRTAQAQWVLPVTNAGSYAVFAQIPRLTNAAAATWEIRADGAPLASTSFPAGTPGLQWIRLGAVALDPRQTNLVVMSAKGGAQGTNLTIAVADVVRVTPLEQTGVVIDNVKVDAAMGTANLLWTTTSPCLTDVEYGSDLRYGRRATPGGPPATMHVATLTNASPGDIVQYMIRAEVGGVVVTLPGQFTAPPPPPPLSLPVFALTNTWGFATNNFDGVAWQATGFNDESWSLGPGLLWVDTRAAGPNPLVQPKGAQMPFNPATGYPYVTYYARAWFDLPVDPAGGELIFTNYIDDGAAFYLNGTGVWRNNLPPAPATVTNLSLATAFNCGGDATCPVVFSLSGAVLTNLVQGLNLLAVEVHNYEAKSPDVTFGSALTLVTPPPAPQPGLKLLWDPAAGATIYWNGTGYVLQETADLTGGGVWGDAEGAAGMSPFPLSGAGPKFFRLRQ